MNYPHNSEHSQTDNIPIPPEDVQCAGELGALELLPTRFQPVAELLMQAATEPLNEFSVDQSTGEEINKNGFAFVAPSFFHQALDVNRNKVFRSENGKFSETTEREGLKELWHFLFEAATSKDEQTKDMAKSLLRNMTFIGSKEFSLGVAALSQYWHDFLSSDSSNQIVVSANISDSDKYPGHAKSDKYVLQHIVGLHPAMFGHERLMELDSTLEVGLDKLELEHTKIILLDDWALSGSQMSRSYAELISQLRAKGRTDLASSVEANFLVASEGRIRNGLQTSLHNPYNPSRTPKPQYIPVKAAFKARNSSVEIPESDNAHITGLHSTANYGFALEIRQIARAMNSKGKELSVPLLCSIIPEYKKEA